MVKRAFLLNQKSGQRVPVDANLVVGRTRECGMFIDDGAASRKHFEISPRGSSFIWRDLGSTNGTVVNGSKMLAGELKNGDEIQVGETKMRFTIEDFAPPEFKVKEDSRLFQETILDSSGHVQSVPAQGKETALLEAVYSVANEIATNYEPCSLLDSVLYTTVQAIDAQRGAVYLSGPQQELLPCPVCNQVHCIIDGALRPAKQDEILISETVVRRVLENGESVLYQDTDSNTDLNASSSIVSLDLRSILCVPLRAKHGILGVLYMDTDRPDQHYTHDHLLLAAAVGNSAGLAMENAQMHQQILEKQRTDQEIATAWTIQEGFLIKDWDIADRRFEVYGETRPAKTVGGDFYDFVQPSPDTVGVLIGDVSGKGVPAALTMAQLLAEFRLVARETSSPVEVLSQLNTSFVKRSRRGLFCSLCYFVLDLQTGNVVAANAGHLPMLRINETGATLIAEASGPPAGILPTALWRNVELKVSPGEMLVMYTDGIVEARSAATRPSLDAEPIEFEASGLLSTASFLHGKQPKEVVSEVAEAVRAFTGAQGPHDDCTLIALRYFGHAG